MGTLHLHAHWDSQQFIQCWNISCLLDFKSWKHGDKMLQQRSPDGLKPSWMNVAVTWWVRFSAVSPRQAIIWYLDIRWLRLWPGVCVRLPCEHVCVKRCKHRGRHAALQQHTPSWASPASELENRNRNTRLLDQFHRFHYASMTSLFVADWYLYKIRVMWLKIQF